MADSPCMKNRSLKAGGRLNRWSLKAGFTVLTDLESGDSSYFAVTEVDKDFDHFQFHHVQQPTTATSTSAKLFPAKRGCCQGKI